MHLLALMKASLAGLATLTAGAIPMPSPPLIGDWIQVYSNYFVQTTKEIDWGCVKVRVNDTTVTKTYDEHHNPKEKRSVTFPKLSYFADLIVKGWSDNYIILTGTDNITMYVWARDFDTFMINDNSGVISQTLGWDYDTTYKALAPSYSEFCVINNN
jgi:hypothetical protein